ncbi:MAG: DUF6197 family protein [Limisphaerales bacterium]
MTTLEILVAARAKIAQGWTQGCLARDARGEQSDCWSKESRFFCAGGALMAACQEGHHAMLTIKNLVGDRVDAWNDAPGRTQAEVLAVFDRAIESAKQ